MNSFIAFLRGINVGGNNSLPMKELVAALETTGARDVSTYIQSGNAVFQTAKKDAGNLAKALSAEIFRRCGFEPQLQIITVEALAKAIADNPFPEAASDPTSLHLGFLATKPANPDPAKLSHLKKDSERYQVTDRIFYLHAPEGVGRSKLFAGAEKILGVQMTSRNWKTVCKVMEMVDK
jgi:uncharacterized protein (DUF1697 family)